MQKLFPAYRVLAYVVGVLLLIGSCASLMKYLLTEGSTLQQLGVTLTPIWLMHGWVFMVYAVVGFLLARRERWTIGFSLTMFVAGLVPLLIFWVEKRVEKKVAATVA